METTTIIGDGGNSKHLPDHSIEACLSAYTAGADALILTVQMTSDRQLVLYRHDDLSVATDGEGYIEDMTLDQLMEVDLGAKFTIGSDYPWKRNSNHTFLRMGRLEDLIRVLEDNVRYFIRPGTARLDMDTRLNIMERVLDLFASTNRVSPTAVMEAVNIGVLQDHFRSQLKSAVSQDTAFADDEVTALKQNAPSYVLASAEQYTGIANALSGETTTCILSLDSQSSPDDLVALIATPDVTGINEASNKMVSDVSEEWADAQADTGRWTLGVSSGHHIMLPMLGALEIGPDADGKPVVRRARFEENPFGASVTTGDGLHVAVQKGRTYASAGAVSRFSLGRRFIVDVDFTYDNPQVSNMMVLAVINQEVWPAGFHRPGVRKDITPLNQNHAFDTHGAAPFVSMEREEDDGFRIMKYTSTGGVYEWYGRFYLGNVGNPQSTAGRLRLERRGRFFTGYYQDENNGDWIGVGTLENASMNDRVYLRLGAKHYPKGGGPEVLFPLNVSFKDLKTLRPAGPVIQEDGPSRIADL
jgi:hypothetical protein